MQRISPWIISYRSCTYYATITIAKNVLLLKVLFTIEKSVLEQHQPTHSVSTNYINFMFKLMFCFVRVLGTISYNTSMQIVYVCSKHCIV